MRKGTGIRRIAMVLSLFLLMVSTIGTTYCYIVAKTEPLTGVFVPGTAEAGRLSLCKTVEHPLGDGYVLPDNISFDFQVELGARYAGARLETTAGALTADEGGALTVTVKPGVTFGLFGLAEGTVVRVTEKPTALDGFAVKGEAERTVTVGEDGDASVSFVNTYSPEAVQPSRVTVGGVKLLEGRDWQDGDSFTFVLEQKDGESWTRLGEQTVTYGAAADFNRFSFNEIFRALRFDKVGTYTFRMREVVGESDADCDETVNHFTVLVTDTDMDGSLEVNTVSGTENAEITETQEGHAVFVTFNNTFLPPEAIEPEPITVPIFVHKLVNSIGEARHGADGFRFVLKNTATSEGLTATSDGNGRASFSLSFAGADIGKTYTYELSEINQGLAGMTYDDDVHEITVTVLLNESNELIAAFTMDGESADSLSATFENIYDAELPDAPAAADNTTLVLWASLTAVSGTVLVFLMAYSKKV